MRICSGGLWLNQTLIPNDSDGTLWGSVDSEVDEAVVGVAGQSTDQPGTPLIDWSADGHSASTMFPNDGSSEIPCCAAIS